MRPPAAPPLRSIHFIGESHLALTVDWHVAARDAQLRAQQKADGRDGIDLSKHDEDLARNRANGEDGVGLAAADSAKVQHDL